MKLRRSFFLIPSLVLAGCTMFHPPRWRITKVHRAADRQEEIQREGVGSIPVGKTDTGLPAMVDYGPAVIDEKGKVRLGIVEFDDFGAFKDERQLTELCRYLRQRPTNAPKLLLVIFVHGWQHDADPHDQNLTTLRRMLCELQGEAWEEEVLGVYVAWPGNIRSLPEDKSGFVHTVQSLGTIQSFGARMNAAERVGRLACTEAMLSMISEAKAFDPDGSGPAKRELRNRERVKTVVIGHSMGALIVERSFVQAMIGYNIINKPVQDQLDLMERSMARSEKGILELLKKNETDTLEQAKYTQAAWIAEDAARVAKENAEGDERAVKRRLEMAKSKTDGRATELYTRYLAEPSREVAGLLDGIDRSPGGAWQRFKEWAKGFWLGAKAPSAPPPGTPTSVTGGTPAALLAVPSSEEIAAKAAAEKADTAFNRLMKDLGSLKQPWPRTVLELGEPEIGTGEGYWVRVRDDALEVQRTIKDHDDSKGLAQLCARILRLVEGLKLHPDFPVEYRAYLALRQQEAVAEAELKVKQLRTAETLVDYDAAKKSYAAEFGALGKLQGDRVATWKEFEDSKDLIKHLDLARRGRIADLVLMGNPASEALVAQQFFDVWKPDRIGTQARLKGGDEGGAQPLLITVSSPADRDTGVIFPWGSAIFRRSADGAADRTDKGKQLVTRTAPQVDSLVTHWAGRGKPTGADFERKRDPSRSEQEVVVTPNEGRNPDLPEEAPLWVVKATADLINSHDVLDDGFRDLVVKLVQQSGQLEPERKEESIPLPQQVVPLPASAVAAAP